MGDSKGLLERNKKKQGYWKEEGGSAKMGDSKWWVGADKILVEKTGGEFDSDFHIVDLKENREIEKIGGILGDRYHPGGLTAVENVLVAIGGTGKAIEEDKYDGVYDLKHDGASYYDLSSPPPDRKWKALPGKMLIPSRKNPTVVSLGTKIFAFAGARGSTGESCFGEYYDTANKAAGWRPVSRRSDVPLEKGGYISDPSRERIICIFNSNNSLYAYYPNKQTPQEQWHLLYEHGVYLRLAMALPCTAADGVLFFYLNDVFTAYDINTNNILRVSVDRGPPGNPLVLSTFTNTPFHISYIWAMISSAYL